jgi:hypothetical protein
MNNSKDASSFYFDILLSLEDMGAVYMIVGGFAAAAYGSTRVTYDMDLVVDIQEAHILALAERYPAPRYYADLAQMRGSIRQGILFNLIDTERGQKVDLIPLSMDPRYREALDRRIRRTIEEPDGTGIDAWFASPEDVIVGKLLAWAESGSRRHEEDIHGILVFIYLGEDQALKADFDEGYIEKHALNMRSDAASLWKRLTQAARKDAEGLKR